MNKKKIFATILCGVFGLSIASGALVANFAHDEKPTIAAPDASVDYMLFLAPTGLVTMQILLLIFMVALQLLLGIH